MPLRNSEAWEPVRDKTALCGTGATVGALRSTARRIGSGPRGISLSAAEDKIQGLHVHMCKFSSESNSKRQY
jgi:hypothetical protein